MGRDFNPTATGSSLAGNDFSLCHVDQLAFSHSFFDPFQVVKKDTTLWGHVGPSIFCGSFIIIFVIVRVIIDMVVVGRLVVHVDEVG
jgi:hypothetical protein